MSDQTPRSSRSLAGPVIVLMIVVVGVTLAYVGVKFRQPAPADAWPASRPR